ncbi:ubiquitin carboxyl-terminal hydrolase 3 isoform X2 [Brachypodium distachyon]|uniref:ubiquitin carboxyl-terminal hydrolase 3 isoform X2 n=1 Tax=Brachypodium distachyon TaxID=15368 RepID=UPI00052FE9D5|nr:ubiquitin carboxyl-terminal hydrolase 3 isoform X2 [Brachypodium distachyon]|eukprot:XP_010240577.1 ubiquitin carboxyl-terminal hydrolase 3 isoform X2 [Brachypodium distachyon]
MAAQQPSSASTHHSGDRWPPLESSPEVFNQFMWSLGVPQGEAEFHDVYGLDPEALAMVPQPALAVLFCFPDPPEDPSNPQEQVLAKEEKIDSLGNACGTIALLHAVGNACSEISLLENSCLDLFFKSTASMDPYERARVLDKDDDMETAHSLAASAGDTELRDIVEEHYICFMVLNGTLYELDGMKGGPIKHGSSSPESLLQDAVHIIKAIMHKIPNSMNFNVMVLSRKPK